MKTNLLAALGLLLVSMSGDGAAAATSCTKDYKTFMSGVSPYIERVDDADLPVLMRRGLSVFEACAAGDMFSPHGIWDQIAEDMRKKSKK